MAALFALDDTLGRILRTTREPLVGQMRLTWWHGALCALDTAPPPAQPVLQALAADVLPRGVSGATLARMIDGWEALLAEPLDGPALSRHAIFRGAGLFEAAAMLGATDRRIACFGRGWAYADICANVRDADVTTVARRRAIVRLARSFGYRRMDRSARALGALALSARMDLEGTARPGSPRRVARLAWHRLTGR